MSSSPLPLLFAFGAALTLVAPAQAQPTKVDEVIVREPTPLQTGHELHSETVKYGDLDLNASDGIKALKYRLRGAARRVCAPAPSRSGELKSQQDYKHCLRGAVDGAVASSGDPRIAKAYEEHQAQR